jgi:hypothetical protein
MKVKLSIPSVAPAGNPSEPNPDAITGTVYVAAPMTMYRKDRYDQQVARVRHCFSRAAILDARSAWSSTADWRRRWPHVLATLAAVVVLADYGWIGAGVVKEVDDARAADVPIWHLTDDGVLHPWESVAICEWNPDDWRRHLRITISPNADSGARWGTRQSKRIRLDPHTPLWFAALMRINPRQAALTVDALTMAGRDDACSICGDCPAPIYEVCEPPYVPLRLCADCWTIQRQCCGLLLLPRNERAGSQGVR